METVNDHATKNTDEALQQNTKAEGPPGAPPHNVSKKSGKEERNKKEDKNIDQFMKSLNSMSSFEEKLYFVCQKYVHVSEENKKLQFYIKQSDKHQAQLVKEKEHLQHEYNVTVLVKSKLENLCRELQKQNKAIKEESLLKIREEDERRKETQAKFQSSLSEITDLLQQNSDRNTKLRDDNVMMTEKFNCVVQQYQLREEQVDKMAKQMALESQLSDAKLQRASLEHQADKKRILAEIEQLKTLAAQYQAKIKEQQETEKVLKNQLTVYTEKYDEFQNAFVKSNKVFGGFKEQIDMMSNKIKKLEKESLTWKKRWESSQTALLEMCAERQATEAQTAASTRQLQHMQNLCRALQAERTALLGKLKEHNIERPPVLLPAAVPPPPPFPAPATTTASNAKMDAMVANCTQLRQSLAHLQSQLNILTTKKASPVEEPALQEKPKKSKSKKKKAAALVVNAKSEEKEDMKETISDTSNDKTDNNETQTTEETNIETKNDADVKNEADLNDDADVKNDADLKGDADVKVVVADVKNNADLKDDTGAKNDSVLKDEADVKKDADLKDKADVKKNAGLMDEAVIHDTDVNNDADVQNDFEIIEK